MLLADVGGHARSYLDRGTKLDHLRMMGAQGVSSLLPTAKMPRKFVIRIAKATEINNSSHPSRRRSF
jgi:hypothetical protein